MTNARVPSAKDAARGMKNVNLIEENVQVGVPKEKAQRERERENRIEILKREDREGAKEKRERERRVEVIAHLK